MKMKLPKVACKSHHLAKYWMHVGRLDFNEDKMSKSLGNVIKIKDLLKNIMLMHINC